MVCLHFKIVPLALASPGVKYSIHDKLNNVGNSETMSKHKKSGNFPNIPGKMETITET